MKTIHELQNNVYRGYLAIMEVESRDLGWKAEDKDAACKQYSAAATEYQNQTGKSHEVKKDWCWLTGMFEPLAAPTSSRLVESPRLSEVVIASAIAYNESMSKGA